MNKKASLLILATVASLALTSCAGSPTETLANKEGNILLTTSVNVSKMPSWEKSSTTSLTSAGFTVTPVVANDLQKANGSFPTFYSAISKDGACNFDMTISALPIQQNPDTEDFTTREELYNNLALQGGTVVGKESMQNIAIQGSEDKLEMLELSYNYPNKVYPVSDAPLFEGTDPTSLPVVEPTVDGTINVISLSRILTSPVTNPFYIANPQIDDANLPPGVVGKTGRPVITMKYSCLNTTPDMKLWDSVVNSSTLSLPIVKK